MNNTAHILRAAAARVRQGWCQGGLVDRHGHVCAIGAIQTVLGFAGAWTYPDLEREQSVRDAVIRALALPQLADKTTEWPAECPIPIWNDAEGQTAENVALGLEYAAILWEQDHQTPAEAHVAEGVAW